MQFFKNWKEKPLHWIFEIKKMEGKSTTPKNCVLTEFLKSKKWKEILLLPKIVLWQNFWNQKNGRKFYYSQKLCFDRIFAWKEYNFPSGFLINTILNFAQECLFPIYAYMVSCAQWSKNLERYLLLIVPTSTIPTYLLT